MLILRRPPIYTRTDTLVPSTALFRSVGDGQRSAVAHCGPRPGHAAGRMAGHEVDGEAQAAQFDRFAVVDDAVDVHWRVEDMVAGLAIVAAAGRERTGGFGVSNQRCKRDRAVSGTRESVCYEYGGRRVV